MLASSTLTRASVPDTLRLATGVLTPMLAQGIILRRPAVVRLASRLQVDRRAVRALDRARRRYGDGPLQLRVPGRDVALVLAPPDVQRVLDESPEPFTPATREKRAALSHFQPDGVLISSGADRAERRRWNETVLEMDTPRHSVGASLVRVVREEVAGLLAESPELTWDRFAPAWWRVVRRIVLGDAARDDVELTDLLAELRGNANWAFLHRTDDAARRRLLAALDDRLERAEPGSLAATVQAGSPDARVAAASQVAHWLFAYDAAGIAVHRALALLAGHPDALAEARAQQAGLDLDTAQDLPLLRETVLESVRLWPTTLAVLRESTAATTWRDGRTAPAGTTFVVVSSFVTRDPATVPHADVFAPECWRDGGDGASWSLVPFSAGPGRCPGRDLVLFTASTLLAAAIDGRELRQTGGDRAEAGTPLPRTVDHTGMTFTLEG